MTEVPDGVKKLFAGINMDELGPQDEDVDSGPWSRVPNRKSRRQYVRGFGDEKRLRSRLRRKR